MLEFFGFLPVRGESLQPAAGGVGGAWLSQEFSTDFAQDADRVRPLRLQGASPSKWAGRAESMGLS